MSPTSGAIHSNPSPQVAAIITLIDGFGAGDTKIFNDIMSDDYTHEVLPKSLGFSIESKKEYLARVGGNRHLLEDFHVRIHDE